MRYRKILLCNPDVRDTPCKRSKIYGATHAMVIPCGVDHHVCSTSVRQCLQFRDIRFRSVHEYSIGNPHLGPDKVEPTLA